MNLMSLPWYCIIERPFQPLSWLQDQAIDIQLKIVPQLLQAPISIWYWQSTVVLPSWLVTQNLRLQCDYVEENNQFALNSLFSIFNPFSHYVIKCNSTALLLMLTIALCVIKKVPMFSYTDRVYSQRSMAYYRNHCLIVIFHEFIKTVELVATDFVAPHTFSQNCTIAYR